jgi:hypothetical protein
LKEVTGNLAGGTYRRQGFSHEHGLAAEKVLYASVKQHICDLASL